MPLNSKEIADCVELINEELDKIHASSVEEVDGIISSLQRIIEPKQRIIEFKKAIIELFKKWFGCKKETPEQNTPELEPLHPQTTEIEYFYNTPEVHVAEVQNYEHYQKVLAQRINSTIIGLQLKKNSLISAESQVSKGLVQLSRDKKKLEEPKINASKPRVHVGKLALEHYVYTSDDESEYSDLESISLS